MIGQGIKKVYSPALSKCVLFTFFKDIKINAHLSKLTVTKTWYTSIWSPDTYCNVLLASFYSMRKNEINCEIQNCPEL